MRVTSRWCSFLVGGFTLLPAAIRLALRFAGPDWTPSFAGRRRADQGGFAAGAVPESPRPGRGRRMNRATNRMAAGITFGRSSRES